ncbi:murein hydrolase activator EnvC family protein [uncultured Sphingomonas sp.]|uniref:murein hydrolase activator EnvC family protein n=1 Tax=uncultured Sphingomonas sp. TaxID=158754 RepID=UPI0035CA651B
MRRLPFAALALALLGAAPPADDRARLLDAKRDAAAASGRADAWTAAATRESDAAARARDEERALTTRVAAAAAGVRAGEARVALIATQQATERARLAAAEAPVARLLGALTSLARQPAIATIAQPGSVDDLVHVRAVLGAALPEMRARTAGVRAELAATRRLQASASLAAQALQDGRGELERQRVALAALEARHRGQAEAFGRSAVAESDRALAFGEHARDLVDRLSEQGEAQARSADLAALPGPLPRPLAPGGAPPVVPPTAYRLPVAGRLVTGLGEVSAAGVRARGLSFAVAPGTPVVAPAAGVVRYAARFRGYGVIVLIDHGDGWSTLLTGLGRSAVRRGASVAADALLGQAARGDAPQVTVELRRRGRPVDIAALIG